MEDNNLKYININNIARLYLGLSILEYCLAESIYHLSNNPKSPKKDWCSASKQTLASNLGITKAGTLKVINRLIVKGIVEKDPITKYLKTTSLWYEQVIILKQKSVNKVTEPVNKVTDRGKQSLPNNNIYINTITSSKEEAGRMPVLLTPNGKKRQNGDINEIFRYLKAKLSIPLLDGSDKKNRQFCYHLLKKFGSVDKVKLLIDATSQHEYWSTRITSFQQLYNHAVNIISSGRDARNSVLKL